MPSSFPCALCGAPLNNNTFEYQKHMTTHWSGTNNTFPLPSISTSTPMPSPISTYPCFFCDNAFYNIRELASHLITSHGPNLHSALCPRAADDSLRNSVSAFLNDYAASGAAFVSLCDCFPGHPAHTLISADDCGAYDSGLGSPVPSGMSDPSSPDGKSTPPASNITPKLAEFLVSEGVTQFGKRVYLYPFEPSAAP